MKKKLLHRNRYSFIEEDVRLIESFKCITKIVVRLHKLFYDKMLLRAPHSFSAYTRVGFFFPCNRQRNVWQFGSVVARNARTKNKRLCIVSHRRSNGFSRRGKTVEKQFIHNGRRHNKIHNRIESKASRATSHTCTGTHSRWHSSGM